MRPLCGTASLVHSVPDLCFVGGIEIERSLCKAPLLPNLKSKPKHVCTHPVLVRIVSSSCCRVPRAITRDESHLEQRSVHRDLAESSGLIQAALCCSCIGQPMHQKAGRPLSMEKAPLSRAARTTAAPQILTAEQRSLWNLPWPELTTVHPPGSSKQESMRRGADGETRRFLRARRT